MSPFGVVSNLKYFKLLIFPIIFLFLPLWGSLIPLMLYRLAVLLFTDVFLYS